MSAFCFTKTALALLLASGAANALPDKALLKAIFTDGEGIKAPGFLDASSFDTLDTDLTITYDVPELKLGSAAPYNDTCGLGVQVCPAMTFDIYPGMPVTTAMTRMFEASGSEPNAMLAPKFGWKSKPGKLYTLIMVDAFSKSSYWAPMPMSAGFHFGCANIPGTDLKSANCSGPYVNPGSPAVDAPSVYAFMLFEHDEQVVPTIYNESLPYNLKLHMAEMKLDSKAKLVGFNYLRAFGTIYSKLFMEAMGMAEKMGPMMPTCEMVKDAPLCFEPYKGPVEVVKKPNSLELAKEQGKKVLVDGEGPAAAELITTEMLATVDRVLELEFDQPAMDLGQMPAPWNDTCSLPSVTLPALKFSVWPGAPVTTAMTRMFALTPGTPASEMVFPLPKFDATTGKYYHLLMVDGFSKSKYWAPMGMTQSFHVGVFNMEDDGAAGIDSGNGTGPYLNPGSPAIDAPSVYAFLIFESDSKLDLTNMMVNGSLPFNLLAYMKTMKLDTDAKLVALNFIKAYGGIYSKNFMYAMGMDAMMGPMMPKCEQVISAPTALTYVDPPPAPEEEDDDEDEEEPEATTDAPVTTIVKASPAGTVAPWAAGVTALVALLSVQLVRTQ